MKRLHLPARIHPPDASELERSEVRASAGPPPRARRARNLRNLLAEASVLALFVAVAAYSTWPLARYLGSRVAGDLGDPLLTAWIFGWGAHALGANPLGVFHANMFFPEPFTLAYAEHMLGQSAMVAPIFWVTGNAVLAMNVATLISYALGAFGVYLLVLDLTGRRSGRGPALAAGIAYGMAPYRIASVVHLQVLGVYMTAPLLLLLFRLRRGRSSKVVALVGLAVGLQFWVSLTGAVITLMAVGIWGLWELARLRRGSLKVIAPAVAGVALGLVISLPALFPYVAVRRIHPDYAHGIESAIFFSATPASYLVPGGLDPPGSLAHAMQARFRDENGWWEKTLFPGFWLSGAFLAGLVGAFVALLRARRRDGEGPAWVESVGLFAAIALGGFLMSLGPRFGADPKGARIPTGLLFSLVPGGLLRVPARFSILVYLGMALVSGVALARLRPGVRRWLVGASFLILAVEMMPPGTVMVKPPPITATHRAVSETTGAVLALPTVELDPQGAPILVGIPREAHHLYISTAHFRPLVNGYGAYHPPSFWEMVRSVQDFPSSSSMAMLRTRGVTTVLVQARLVRDTRWADVEERLESWPGVRRIAGDREAAVYDISRIKAAPARANHRASR